MNKAITVMLILVGVLLILLFPSLHLESGNIILFLISVFVIGFFAGGFANLDNITKANQDNVFYQREVGRKNAIIQDITRERDNYRLEHDNRREDTEALIKLKDQKEAILRQYRGMEDNIDMTSINSAIEKIERQLGLFRGN